MQIDRTTWKRLRALVVPFFCGDLKWAARGLLALVILFGLSVHGISYLLSYLNRDMWNALELKEKDEFYLRLGYYLIGFMLATPVQVFYTYSEQRTALLWRRWLAQQLLTRYFSGFAFYKIGWYEGIDNPDQRMEEDVRTFTTMTLSFFLILFNALITIVLFGPILYSISSTLLVAALIYATVGSVLTSVLGRALPRLNFDQVKKQANYRYKLVNVRDNAESIAFYRGAKKENTRARQRLKIEVDNFRRIICVSRNISFLRVFYDLFKPVLPIVLVAPLFLAGKFQLGVIPQSVDAFLRVVDALSIIVAHFATISTLTASISRLGTFQEVVEAAAKDAPRDMPKIDVREGKEISFEDITILTPKRDQVIIKDLSFTTKEDGLLITGTSGSGKSSILRVIAGLWEAGEGKLVRPPIREMMFIPQRPYMVLGSLRNQLLYALHRRGVSEKELKHVMEQVGLEDTLRRAKGFDTVLDWPNILSTGEQQRLAFARLILAKPKYAFLDEATTALDSASEARLYRLLEKTTANYISVGYSTTLVAYHKKILELYGNGDWKLKESK